MNSTRQNSATWVHRRFVRHYLGTDLRPAETLLLSTYREQFAGHVLEIGCGTGRATGHLAQSSNRVEALDISGAMLEEARRRHPTVTFHELSMTDLGGFDEASFDAVIATCNVIDVLADADRRAFLRAVRRLLTPHGVFAFSSHNRNHIPHLREPWQLPTHRVLAFGNALVRLPLRLWNRHQLQHGVVHAEDYEILNDAAHDWRLLQYYIRPADQRRQLAECGLELELCMALDGSPVADTDSASEQVELYYAARPIAQS